MSELDIRLSEMEERIALLGQRIALLESKMGESVMTKYEVVITFYGNVFVSEIAESERDANELVKRLIAKGLEAYKRIKR